MNTRISKLLSKILIFLMLCPVKIAAAIDTKNLETFPIHISPSPEDWRGFLLAQPEDRAQLWHYHSNRDKLLKDWSWEWRLAWIKTCIIDSSLYCSHILKAALTDKAAVVRAEAADLIGKRFMNSKSLPALKILHLAYTYQITKMQGKPLFVQLRILKAIHSIGGKHSLGVGTKAAKYSKATKSYWSKLRHQSKKAW